MRIAHHMEGFIDLLYVGMLVHHICSATVSCESTSSRDRTLRTCGNIIPTQQVSIFKKSRSAISTRKSEQNSSDGLCFKMRYSGRSDEIEYTLTVDPNKIISVNKIFTKN